MVGEDMVVGRLDTCDAVGNLRPDYWPRLISVFLSSLQSFPPPLPFLLLRLILLLLLLL